MLDPSDIRLLPGDLLEGWHPIDTAPVDTWVQLYWGDGWQDFGAISVYDSSHAGMIGKGRCSKDHHFRDGDSGGARPVTWRPLSTNRSESAA